MLTDSLSSRRFARVPDTAAARASSSSSGVVSVASSGMRSVTVDSSSYARSVASRIASVILSARSARFMGLLSSWATRSARPTTMPAWTPPSSLSPENVTRSTPAAIISRGVGSCGRPNPREIEQGAAAEIDADRQVARPARGRTSSFSLTDLANPSMW